MKKIIIPIIAIVATLASCQKDLKVLRLEMEHFDANGEKLHLNGDNYACWDNGDKVAVNGVNSYQITVGTDQNTATINVGQEVEGPYYAFAPAGSNFITPITYNNGIYQFTYPAKITLTKAANLNSFKTTLYAPMYATSTEDNTLVFKNQGAVLDLVISAAQTASMISLKVTVADGILSGTFSTSTEGATCVAEATNSVQIVYRNETGIGKVQNITNNPTFVRIPIPVTTGTRLRVEIATTDGLYYFEKATSVNFERSKIYTIPCDLGNATFIEPIFYESNAKSGDHGDLNNIEWSADYLWYMYDKPKWIMAFSNTITEIPQNAFSNDTKAANITLPGTITSIGADAFNGCTKLNWIKLKSLTPPTLGNETVFSNIGMDLTTGPTQLYVPAASADAYRAAWGTNGTIGHYFDDINIIGF